MNLVILSGCKSLAILDLKEAEAKIAAEELAAYSGWPSSIHKCLEPPNMFKALTKQSLMVSRLSASAVMLRRKNRCKMHMPML